MPIPTSDPLGTPPTPMSCTEMQRLIGRKPVEMEPRQLKGYYFTSDAKLMFAMACAYPQGDKTLVKQIGGFSTCRETASTPLSQAHARPMQHCVMVEAEDKESQKPWARYINLGEHVYKGLPTVLIMNRADLKKIRAGLRVIHHYERLARAGKTRVYKLKHESYFAHFDYYVRPPKYTITDDDSERVLVVGPGYWHMSVPMLSMYMLLLRAINWRKPNKNETAKAYLDRVSTKKTLYSRDTSWLNKVYNLPFDGESLDMISVCCRRWRLLRRAQGRYHYEYQGSNGSASIAEAVEQRHKLMNRYQNPMTDKRATNTAANKLILAHRQFFIELVAQLRREKRRVTRAKNKAGVAQEGEVVQGGSADSSA